MLLDLAEPEDEIIVFYTKNSPHMSYASVVSLIRSGRSIQFEECHEGNNALDFQLVSYMGYLMKDRDAEYHIMSNDTGFDAAVRFWRERGFQIKRINVNYCKLQVQNLKKKAAAQAAEAERVQTVQEEAVQVIPEEPVQAPEEKMSQAVQEEPLPMIQEEPVQTAGEETLEMLRDASALTVEVDVIRIPQEEQTEAVSEEAVQNEQNVQTESEEAEHTEVPAEPESEVVVQAVNEPAEESDEPEVHFDFNKEEVDFFINCLDKNDLAKIHETLVHVYGQKQGSNIYNIVKDKSYPFEKKEYSRKEKIEHFLDIIFANNQMKAPGDFVEFLEETKGKTKNLNSMRATIIKYYGNANGMKYYSMFKPYFKTISAFQ